MGNHYHLLVSEIVDGGITKFIMKLNVGYAKYFNARYKRVGTLFQGRTKIHINSTHIFFTFSTIFILTPSTFERRRKRRTLEIKKQKTRLPTSIHTDGVVISIIAGKNFPSIITKELFGDISKNYGQKIASYLKDIEINDIRPFLLE